jgi:hypothetical protein
VGIAAPRQLLRHGLLIDVAEVILVFSLMGRHCRYDGFL